MNPEELALIEAYLADLRAATVRYGQEAFQRHNPEEAHRHADRLTELNRADEARMALVAAIQALRRALAAFPPLPEERAPTPPPGLESRGFLAVGPRPTPTVTDLAPDLDGQVLSLKDGPRQAAALYNDRIVVVKAGSEARSRQMPSLSEGYSRLRAALMRDGALVPKNLSTLTFTQDTAFSSPSAAAAVILGRSANGRKEWRREDGRTLHADDESR